MNIGDFFKPEHFQKFMGCFIYILHFHFDNEMRAFPLFIEELKNVALNQSVHQSIRFCVCFRIYKMLPQFSNSWQFCSEEV